MDTKKHPDYWRLLGNVSFKHNNATMECDSAHHYSLDNKIEAFGKVVISKEEKTVDSFFSLNIKEFTDMVTMVRNTEAALGTDTYNLPDKINLKGRRSLYIAKDIQKGSKITENNIASVRPGFGLHPKYYDQVISKIVNKNLKKGDRLKLEDLS